MSAGVLKSYELRERIGSGGFAEVYRAYQPIIDREVKPVWSPASNIPILFRYSITGAIPMALIWSCAGCGQGVSANG
jgi:hypothetical protein